jgi:signal transduction histidine kinase
VQLARAFSVDPVISVQKHKVLQILVNLIRNAEQACDEGGREDKRITVAITMGASGRVSIQVADNGVGMAADTLERLFGFGFTTRKAGHGFGLHSSINAARALGGNLTAHSDGAGQGATFTLDLPLDPSQTEG